MKHSTLRFLAVFFLLFLLAPIRTDASEPVSGGNIITGVQNEHLYQVWPEEIFYSDDPSGVPEYLEKMLSDACGYVNGDAGQKVSLDTVLDYGDADFSVPGFYEVKVTLVAPEGYTFAEGVLQEFKVPIRIKDAAQPTLITSFFQQHLLTQEYLIAVDDTESWKETYGYLEDYLTLQIYGISEDGARAGIRLVSFDVSSLDLSVPGTYTLTAELDIAEEDASFFVLSEDLKTVEIQVKISRPGDFDLAFTSFLTDTIRFSYLNRYYPQVQVLYKESAAPIAEEDLNLSDFLPYPDMESVSARQGMLKISRSALTQNYSYYFCLYDGIKYSAIVHMIDDGSTPSYTYIGGDRDGGDAGGNRPSEEPPVSGGLPSDPDVSEPDTSNPNPSDPGLSDPESGRPGPGSGRPDAGDGSQEETGGSGTDGSQEETDGSDTDSSQDAGGSDTDNSQGTGSSGTDNLQGTGGAHSGGSQNGSDGTDTGNGSDVAGTGNGSQGSSGSSGTGGSSQSNSGSSSAGGSSQNISDGASAGGVQVSGASQERGSISDGESSPEGFTISELQRLLESGGGTLRFSENGILAVLPADTADILSMSDSDTLAVQLDRTSESTFTFRLLVNGKETGTVPSVTVAVPYAASSRDASVYLVNESEETVAEGTPDEDAGTCLFQIQETGAFTIRERGASSSQETSQGSRTVASSVPPQDAGGMFSGPAGLTAALAALAAVAGSILLLAVRRKGHRT